MCFDIINSIISQWQDMWLVSSPKIDEILIKGGKLHTISLRGYMPSLKVQWGKLHKVYSLMGFCVIYPFFSSVFFGQVG